MKRNRVLAIILAAMMLLGIAGAMAEDNAKYFEKYPETITVTSVKNLGGGTLEFPEGDSIDDNVWTRKFLEDLNIQVKYLWTTNEQQFGQKVNVAIASNDLPDVLLVTGAQLQLMHENGQLMDVTQIVEDNIAPFTREILYSDGGLAIKSATFGGKLYAIPSVGSGLLSAPVLWVRTDWLKNVGMEAPKTMDELRAVADAFTNKDPDGNGQKDTFGLVLYKDIFGGGFGNIEGLFNGFGAFPNVWIEKDGKLVHGSIQPEVKEALQFVQDLYKDGLVDPEFGVKDANKVAEDVSANKLGMFFGSFWNAAWINDAKVANPDMDWIPVAVPTAGDEPATVQVPFGTTGYYAISPNAEHPEAVVRMLNLQLEKTYGETAEPTVYAITPEGYGPYQYPPIAMEPPMKNFIAAEKVTAALEGGDLSELNDEEKNYYDMAKLSLDGDHKNNNWHQLKMFGPGGSLSVIDKYFKDGHVKVDAFYGTATDTMTQRMSTLGKQQLTDFTAIILGESADKFDTFVENWNKLGGETITQEVNDWLASVQ